MNCLNVSIDPKHNRDFQCIMYTVDAILKQGKGYAYLSQKALYDYYKVFLGRFESYSGNSRNCIYDILPTPFRLFL